MVGACTMKRKIVGFLSLVFILVVMAVGVCGCKKSGDIGKAKVLEKSENLVVIQVEECEDNVTVYDVMVWLQEKGELEFISENSIYGQSLLSLNGKDNPDDWSSYWQFYTINATQGNPDKSKSYGGYTLYYANVGISGAYVQDGGVYLWEFAISEW